MSWAREDDSPVAPPTATPRLVRLGRWCLVSLLPPLALALVCAAVRGFLHCGFVMGDDAAVVGITDVKRGDLTWHLEQVNLRFGVWAPYLLSGKLFGTGELGFFMPTLIVSSSFAAVAYLLLRRLGYSFAGSVFGGLFVGLSPFEVLIGTSFANDIFLAGAFVYAYLAWQYRDRLPNVSGILVAVLLWFAFFNKAWAVYLVPFLAVDFVADVYRRRRLAFWASTVVVTLVLHAATAYSYMRSTGDPFPLLHLLPAHYPVPRSELLHLLLTYPYQIVVGDELTRSTLFGPVAYVWLVALCCAVVLRGPREVFRRDRFGTELLVMWLGVFLLINFVPNYYSLTEYHSAPRIFRYLTPISFFLSLHAAKLLLDCSSRLAGRLPASVVALLGVLLLAANLVGAFRATAPGRQNRRAVDDVVAAVAERCPPVLIMENWQGYFFGRLYLHDKCPRTRVVNLSLVGFGDEHIEENIHVQLPELPRNAMLVTGLGSYVYYPCIGCFIDAAQLKLSPADGWERVRDAGRLTFRPTPVEAEVWRYRGAAAERARSE